MALAATVIGLAGTIAAFAYIVSSYSTATDDFRSLNAATVIGFDQLNRQLLRNIMAQGWGRLGPADSQGLAVERLARAQSARSAACDNVNRQALHAPELLAICQDASAFYARLTIELATFDPPTRQIDQASVNDGFALAARLGEVSYEVARNSDSLVERSGRSQRSALLVLGLCASASIAMGAILLGLVSRASAAHRDAFDRAEDAGRLLAETMDALPGGIALFDRDDRLVMLNSVARELTVALDDASVTGDDAVRGLRARGGGQA